MTSCRDPGLDRLDYGEGARLLARDLSDTRGNEARWQALHVRGLHDTWGVATGLRLRLTPNGRGLVVEVGAAFDCRGQVIRLDQSVELPMPSTPAVGFPPPAFDVVLDHRGARWEPTGGGIDAPGFGTGVRLGLDIPLGRTSRLLWGILTEPDFTHRKTAHPMTRPRVGFGLTPAGGLDWLRDATSIRSTVDTSAAEFHSTPRYVASVSQAPGMSGLLGPFLSLSSFYPGRFTARLIAVSRAGLPATDVLEMLLNRAGGIRIAWMGIEPNVGCW